MSDINIKNYFEEINKFEAKRSYELGRKKEKEQLEEYRFTMRIYNLIENTYEDKKDKIKLYNNLMKILAKNKEVINESADKMFNS